MTTGLVKIVCREAIVSVHNNGRLMPLKLVESS